MPTLTFSKPSTTSAIFAMMKCNTKGTGLGNTEVITRLDGSNICLLYTSDAADE